MVIRSKLKLEILKQTLLNEVTMKDVNSFLLIIYDGKVGNKPKNLLNCYKIFDFVIYQLLEKKFKNF